MKVKFLPQDIELEIAHNQSVMELAHENGVNIKSVCNGMPSCAECRVRLVEGEANVMPPSNKELSLIGTGHYLDQRRLSCQLLCFGDVTIDLTEQNEKAAEGPRRPQGAYVKEETEKSFAVTGNLIDDAPEISDEALDAEAPKEKKDDFYKGLKASGKDGKDKKKSGGKKRRRRPRRKGRGSGGSKPKSDKN